MICPSLLSAIQHHCRVSARKYQPCMFGDDAFFENDSVTAVLKHRACHESDGKKKKKSKKKKELSSDLILMALTKNKHTRTEKSGWCRVIWGWQRFKTELQGRARTPRLVPDVPKNKIKNQKKKNGAKLAT